MARTIMNMKVMVVKIKHHQQMNIFMKLRNITETLLYGDSSYDNTNNTLVRNATMEFLFASKRFDMPLD